MRSRAKALGIWEAVDPTKTIKPTQITEPPELDLPAAGDAAAQEQFKTEYSIFRHRTNVYNRRRKPLQILLPTFKN